MKTSSKYKKLVRQRKLRRQRSVALAIFLIMVVMIAHVAFSKQSTAGENSVLKVVVCEGDTVWSIAEEYAPEGADFNEYLHTISANNGIKDGNIYCGQVLYIPVEA